MSHQLLGHLREHASLCQIGAESHPQGMEVEPVVLGVSELQEVAPLAIGTVSVIPCPVNPRLSGSRHVMPQHASGFFVPCPRPKDRVRILSVPPDGEPVGQCCSQFRCERLNILPAAFGMGSGQIDHWQSFVQLQTAHGQGLQFAGSQAGLDRDQIQDSPGWTVQPSDCPR